jgi:hypothetical protein
LLLSSGRSLSAARSAKAGIVRQAIMGTYVLHERTFSCQGGKYPSEERQRRDLPRPESRQVLQRQLRKWTSTRRLRGWRNFRATCAGRPQSRSRPSKSKTCGSWSIDKCSGSTRSHRIPTAKRRVPRNELLLQPVQRQGRAERPSLHRSREENRRVTLVSMSWRACQSPTAPSPHSAAAGPHALNLR